MKLNTIARTLAAVILSLAAITAAAGTAAADRGNPDTFLPPFVVTP
jgi:hypothetical protein